MNIDYFQSRFAEAARRERAYHASANRLSFARLMSFCLILFAAALGFDQRNPFWYALSLVGALLFLYFVSRHRAMIQLRRTAISEQSVLKKYVDRFSDDWHAFAEDGSEYLSAQSTHAKDLDLLGRNSLYQYLLAANTACGKKRLAEALLKPRFTKAEIEKRQEAIGELARKIDFSIALQTLSSLLTKTTRQVDGEALLFAPDGARPRDVERFQILLTGLPVITICSVFLAMTGNVDALPATLLLVIQLAASGIGFWKNSAMLQPLFSRYEKLAHYERLFRLLEQSEFSSTYLNELQAILSVDGGARRNIRGLYRIGECVNMRYNIIFFLMANSLVLWDYHLVIAFNRWKRAHGDQIRRWFDALGEFESLLSLSVLCHVKESYCFPEILPNAAPRLDGEGMYHPLIAERKAVANTVTLGASTSIVTGSNMSGKTTFLRTLGTCGALAYAGAPVCARRFAVSPMRILTSMRIEDDISKGVSTFYAELLRIKTMVEYSKTRQPMLVLIDEIFKGTNSADRIIGATETIKKLTNAWSITLVSTHDFELCGLAGQEQGAPVANYHFSETYTDDEIHFDYRLKAGRCRTTNAKYLLRMAGIL